MKWSELILLAGLACFAGVILHDSLDMPYRSSQAFGPGFIPLNMAIATLALCGLLLVRAVVAGLRSGEMALDLARALPAIGAIALLLLATAAASFGSVLGPLAVAMTVISALLLGHGWVRSVLLTAATLAVIYAIFSLWLNIPVT
ncbi:tripartite tricarboxylate transporter TctB family protein [Roseibacterium beibuensis]|uniref:DUF1468 domain-containing protein n=1 Tax=[Roseibacterium] beibuensis TaxID=1193142 RepID=A0ABP9KRG5_9RHOB|nr:tripartite tricarboxylate transporter TctB family protein [Roseibacterium beibuensis]MCS6622525.1 tripartite tricarboxylate transporter TctB family protein [Roseibacterium beibuensis]